jgi:hypothetical protein
MSISREPAGVRIGRIIYCGLLVFYPLEFRRKFGEEMLDVFLELLRQALAEGSAFEVFSLWRSVLWEVVIVALPSRLGTDAVIAGALSVLASAALFLFFFRAVT